MVYGLALVLLLGGVLAGGFGAVAGHVGLAKAGCGLVLVAVAAAVWRRRDPVTVRSLDLPPALWWLAAAVLLAVGQALMLAGSGDALRWVGFPFPTRITGWVICLAAAACAWIGVRRPTGVRLALAFSPWFLILPLIAVLGWWAVSFIRHVSLPAEHGGRYYALFDDAMIAMRYAWNLAHGQGLVWNPGERVEGYTSLLMVLVMSAGAAVLTQSLAVLYTQIAGLVFITLTAFVNVQLAGHMFVSLPDERRKTFQALAFAATLLYYPALYWSVMGMETSLLTLLLALATWQAVAAGGTPRFRPFWAALLGLMSITRPDATLQAGLLFMYHVLLTADRRPRTWLRLAGEAAIWLAFPAAQLAFRLGYYGEWLPNTYYLKLDGMPLNTRLANGVGFLRPFVASVAPAAALAVVGVWFRPRPARLLLLSLFLSTVGYQAYVGGDPWLYWRIMAPTLPMLFMLSLAGADALLGGAARWVRAPRWINGGRVRQVTAMLAFLACLGVANTRFLPELYQQNVYDFTIYPQLIRIALNLREISKPTATVGVIWGGTIPYYSGLRALDFLGKCDARIARLAPNLHIGFNGMVSVPGHNKYDLTYSIRERQPDYVQEAYWCSDDQTAYVQEHYVKRRNLWLRKDSPHIRWDVLARDH